MASDRSLQFTLHQFPDVYCYTALPEASKLRGNKFPAFHRCQHATGSAFAQLAVIESTCFEVIGNPYKDRKATHLGMYNDVVSCGICRVSLWEYRPEHGTFVTYIHTGTLDHPSWHMPQIHRYISTQFEWVRTPENVPTTYGDYDRQEMWTGLSIIRWEALKRSTSEQFNFDLEDEDPDDPDMVPRSQELASIARSESMTSDLSSHSDRSMVHVSGSFLLELEPRDPFATAGA
ncbi:hypothetical protein FQN57_003764 [Myotisia sp. PD_48]|nr:hypothetical protein FQN57_003764 [Myotisia sp. PD_48]